MHKRFFFFLLVLILLPVCCHAEPWTEEMYSPSGQLERRGYIFQDELPQQLVAPLADWGYGDARILSGAAIEEPGDAASPEDDPSFQASFSALMLAEIEGETQLIGAAWVEGQPWQVVNFGSRLLRQTENLSMGYMTWDTARPALAIGYWGMQEEQQFDLFMFSGNRLWEMVGHSDSHIRISTSNDIVTVWEDPPKTRFRLGSFWMEYMSSISEFPTTYTECEQLQQAILLAEEAAGSALCYTDGANLWAEPSQTSQSLGMYQPNIPAVDLGEQAQGDEWPWLRLRIGNTEGWMSAQYVHTGLPNGQLPTLCGRTLTGCALYAQAYDSSPALELPSGTSFHILAETENERFHICVPSGGLGPEVDTNGTYGYVSKSAVMTGASPIALDALEKKAEN